MPRLSLSSAFARSGPARSRVRKARRPRLEGLEDRPLLTATNPASVTIQAFPLTTTATNLTNPVVDWEGNLWFTEEQGAAPGNNVVVRVTRDGKVSETPLPAGLYATGPLTVGGDGELWVPASTQGVFGATTTIDRISYTAATGLVVQTYAVAGNPAVSSLALGPDGNLWFVADTASSGADPTPTDTVDKIAPDGTITAFPAPGAFAVESLRMGPDGNLWLSGGGELAKVATDGTVTPVPLPDMGMSYTLTSGPDGDLYVPYLGISTGVGLARVTTDGVVTTLPVPNVRTLTIGGDGNLWFTRNAPGSSVTTIGSIAMDGTARLTTLSTTVAGRITEPGVVGADGNLYFIEQSTNTRGTAIVEVAQDGSVAVSEIPLVPPSPGGVFSPPPASTPDPVHGLTVGGDGNLWFLDGVHDAVGQLNLNLPVPVYTPPPPGSPIPIIVYTGGVYAGGVFNANASSPRAGIPASAGGGGGFAGGPIVQSVARSGVRRQPTKLTVTFNVGLNGVQADNLKNYTLVMAGPRGKSRPHARGIAIKSAVYNAATHTVTLTPSHRLPLKGYFKLTVVGASPTGITGVTGAKLGAPGLGQSGTDFTALLHKFGPVAPKTTTHHAAKHHRTK